MEMFEVCHLCGSFAVGGFDTDYRVPTCEDCADVPDHFTSTIDPRESLDREMDDIDEWYEDDGQPDEAQEWHDFDPDC
jgi:hypothetical protein